MDFGRKRLSKEGLSKEDVNILINSIVISNTPKKYFTANNVDTTGEPNNSDTFPIVVVNNEGNVVTTKGDFE